MDSSKGSIKWLIGFFILGVIVYYIMIMSGQQKNDISISRSNFDEKVMKFEKDFYQTQADITIHESSKERLLKSANDIDQELEKIKLEREEKIKRQKELEEKERQILEKVENRLNQMNSEIEKIEIEAEKSKDDGFFFRLN